MKLKEIRKKVDAIDRELLQLLQTRMEFALRSTRFKEAIADEKREKTVLGNVKRLSHDLLDGPFTDQLFKTIIGECTRLQAGKRALVSFQGEHGAYSDAASRRLVPMGAYIPCSEFPDVFHGVEKGFFDLGVVPVENSVEGAVTQVNDLLTTTNLKVIGETAMPIHHCLIATMETNPDDVNVVYSHPQALGQCRGYLEENKLEARLYYDTAGAAKMLARDRPMAAAAIASALSAELYDLNIIKEGIEDSTSNSTRFLLISKEPFSGDGNKCSIIFATDHEAGRLYGVLKLFADAHINLTRIASMPLRTDPGNYAFFLDFEGNDKDKRVADVLSQLTRNTKSFKFLGCYPKDTG